MKLICGIDEVGRGCLAGPVLASAVILPEDRIIEGLRDSKQLNHTQRVYLAECINSQCLAAGYGRVEHYSIDSMNIHNASLLAMLLALDNAIRVFKKTTEADRVAMDEVEILIDGKFLPRIENSAFYEEIRHCRREPVVRGDSLVPAISAASILAKVCRDLWMIEHHTREPKYGFYKHKGYPTPEHKDRIRSFGPSSIQRMSFRCT